MKNLSDCKVGDIISRWGVIYKIMQLYCSDTQATMLAARLNQKDEWETDQYAGYWPADMRVRFLGRE